MRTSDIFLVISALAGSGLACTSRPATEATEVPTNHPTNLARDGGEGSCRHELGRCGGHKPGDAACSGVAANPTETPLDDVLVEPGKFAEINLEMAAGAATDIAFTATGGPLEWNVHSHDGDRVAIHAEGAATAGKIRFAAPHAGPFSYLWKNTGTAPVRLTTHMTAQGAVRVQSIHPAP